MALILNLNKPLTVQLVGEGTRVDLEGFLFGCVEGEHLIVGGFEGEPFTIGQELAIRMRLDGNVVGFWAKVIDKVNVSGIHYFLSYPEQIETLELRVDDRLAVLLPAEVQISSLTGASENTTLLQGVMTNISPGGCCLNSKIVIPANNICTLKFSLPGDSAVYVLEGKIVRSGHSGEVQKQGVAFDRTTSDSALLSKFSEWIQQQQSMI